MKKNHFGTLFIVATPLGNLGDMSPRAIEILKTVDVVAAEDTRHSKPLLQHFLINTPLIPLHEHNEREQSRVFLQRLLKGESIAIISDAGTPLVSDPGFFMVREAIAEGIQVVPLPGPCAAITALSASGMPTDRFSFEGFLPVKDSHRRERLEQLLHETRTLIFYEAPHRVLACLKDMQKIFGDERRAVIARELTKMFETIHSAPLNELVRFVTEDSNQQRGEIVLIVAGAEKEATEESAVSADSVLKILLAELPLKQAVDLTAKITGGRKNELYQRALDLKKSTE